MAWIEVQADTCSGCQQPLSQSTHPDAEGGYEVPDPTRCHSCTVLHKHQAKYEEAGTAPGLLFETTRRR